MRGFAAVGLLFASTAALASCSSNSAGNPPAPTPTILTPPTTLPTVSVDLRQYIAAAISTGDTSGNISGGSMLCDPLEDNVPDNPSCLTSFESGDTGGEVVIANGNGIIDYVAITSEQQNPFGEGSLNYIGVARNYPADGSSLRCFTTARVPSVNCTAPPSGHVFGAPYIINHLPVVVWATAQVTENDPDPQALDAWPITLIPEALVSTVAAPSGSAPANFWNVAVNGLSSTCAQTHEFNTLVQERVVYVSGVPFGGTIGTKDAVVLESVTTGANPNHIERYYYVKGYGRVRESTSYEANGVYGKITGDAMNMDGSSYRPVNPAVIYANGNHGGCSQGSAVPID